MQWLLNWIAGVPNNLGVPFLGVPIIRTIAFGGSILGPPILGNYHREVSKISAYLSKGFMWFNVLFLASGFRGYQKTEGSFGASTPLEWGV